jgi:tetratricopeptide (TPR) repeat protein
MKQTIIIEKSPNKTAVYDSKKEDVVCSNHYQSETFLNDTVNIANIKNSDSKYRHDRMKELLNKEYPIDYNKAIDILRNKDGINNEFIGYGNPKALNQLIAHHGIIFKPMQKQFWISTPPYQLGNFICYDLNTIFNKKEQHDFSYIDSLTVAADPFLKSLAYKKYEVYKNIKQRIQKYTMLGIPMVLTRNNEELFIETNPNNYNTYMSLGDYYKTKGNFKKAIRYYSKSLNYSISSLDEEAIIKAKIVSCQELLTE